MKFAYRYEECWCCLVAAEIFKNQRLYVELLPSHVSLPNGGFWFSAIILAPAPKEGACATSDLAADANLLNVKRHRQGN
jgi:hypothetical protein